VLGVWPLHGLCGAWGGLACGIFGTRALGGLGGVTFAAQAAGTALAIAIAFGGGVVVYGVIKTVGALRLTPDEESEGADQTIHRISSTPASDW
jgi:ammonium transporter, Amt family